MLNHCCTRWQRTSDTAVSSLTQTVTILTLSTDRDIQRSTCGRLVYKTEIMTEPRYNYKCYSLFKPVLDPIITVIWVTLCTIKCKSLPWKSTQNPQPDISLPEISKDFQLIFTRRPGPSPAWPGGWYKVIYKVSWLDVKGRSWHITVTLTDGQHFQSSSFCFVIVTTLIYLTTALHWLTGDLG